MRNTQLPTIIATIFSFLNENVEYAVLRNYDGLPTKNKSRDIDILIDRNSFSKIKKDLVKLIEKSNFKIITYFNSDRICTFVCGQYNSEPSIFQLDFFFHFYNNRHNFYSLRSNRLQFRVASYIASPALCGVTIH